MKTRMVIHPDYNEMVPYLNKIPAKYGEMGRLVHTGRNEVRITPMAGVRVAVKSYKRITVVSRIVYAWFRKSKAQRAYENALVLLNSGIATPIPVAYIDCYRHGILRKSYFVSVFMNSKPSKDLFALPFHECDQALYDLSRFVYRLHRLGIFHNDLTLGNILYERSQEGYDFCLIDNNRIRFRNYSETRALRNLRKINLSFDKYAFVANKYSRLMHRDTFDTAHQMLFYRDMGKRLVGWRRSAKGVVKRLLSRAS